MELESVGEIGSFVPFNQLFGQSCFELIEHPFVRR